MHGAARREKRGRQPEKKKEPLPSRAFSHARGRLSQSRSLGFLVWCGRTRHERRAFARSRSALVRSRYALKSSTCEQVYARGHLCVSGDLLDGSTKKRDCSQSTTFPPPPLSSSASRTPPPPPPIQEGSRFGPIPSPYICDIPRQTYHVIDSLHRGVLTASSALLIESFSLKVPVRK